MSLPADQPLKSPIPASKTEVAASPRTWLRSSTDMGKAIAAHAWEKTPLGPIEHWPAELRFTVNLMLRGGAAMALVWGPDYNMLYNDGYRDVIQDKHPAALGRPTQEIFPEIWAEIEPLFQRAYTGEAVVLDDFALSVQRNGKLAEAYFSGSYNPIENEAGEVGGFLAVVVETTRRVAREQERARVFDTTLSAIADFAYSFDREGRFLYVNKALLDLWGMKLEDAVGKNFFELPYPAELAAHLQRQIQEVIDRKTVVRDETLYVSPTGDEGYYEYIFSPVFAADGSVVVVAGSTRNITDRKKLERQLENQADVLEQVVQDRTARLQETVTELEAFSYSISHDLRAPLRSMQSFAQALEEDCGAQIGAIGQDYIGRIVRSATRMDRIIQDVLVYSRIARTELPLERIELHEFITSLLEGYPSFHDNKAEIAVAAGLPAVMANPAALTQCIANLIGNALKFVAPGVRPDVWISAQILDGRAAITISDNGIGIPAKAHEQIFAIFHRLHPDYEGTGIGLAIVRKAVERMGGKITLRSEPGLGSAFTFDLAVAEAEQK